MGWRRKLVLACGAGRENMVFKIKSAQNDGLTLTALRFLSTGLPLRSVFLCGPFAGSFCIGTNLLLSVSVHYWPCGFHSSADI